MWSVQVPVEKLQPDSRLKASGLMDGGGASTCLLRDRNVDLTPQQDFFPLQQSALAARSSSGGIDSSCCCPAECQDT